MKATKPWMWVLVGIVGTFWLLVIIGLASGGQMTKTHPPTVSTQSQWNAAAIYPQITAECVVRTR